MYKTLKIMVDSPYYQLVQDFWHQQEPVLTPANLNLVHLKIGGISEKSGEAALKTLGWKLLNDEHVHFRCKVGP